VNSRVGLPVDFDTFPHSFLVGLFAFPVPPGGQRRTRYDPSAVGERPATAHVIDESNTSVINKYKVVSYSYILMIIYQEPASRQVSFQVQQ